MQDLKTNEKLPTNLEQLTVEIKFYVNQWGQNTIEIGKCLIEAKKLVPHGDWQNWLENNFNLSYRMAAKFMQCAEKFSNVPMSAVLNPSQMFELLALPAEETEKFIAEKKAENNPVEDMTVKELREEVAKYKADFEKHKSEVENLFNDKSDLERQNSILQKNYDELTSEKNSLQEQLKNQKPIIKNPADYEPIKAERDDLRIKIERLQKELNNKPLEIQVPADYETNKKQLTELQQKYEEIEKFAVLIQKFDSISQLLRECLYMPGFTKALAYYKQTNGTAYASMAARLKDFIQFVKE